MSTAASRPHKSSNVRLHVYIYNLYMYVHICIYTYIGPITEEVAAVVAQAVLSALHYIHTVRKLIHRDIKPSNILLNARVSVDFFENPEPTHTHTRVCRHTYAFPQVQARRLYAYKLLY